MDRIKRLAEYEIQELKDVISYIKEDFDEELVIDEMPTNLFGIALDYGFNDTEVREWIWKFVEDYDKNKSAKNKNANVDIINQWRLIIDDM